MKTLRLAYFGTPSFSADVFHYLYSRSDMPVEWALVITQPDKPTGRDKIPTASPVKDYARAHAIPVIHDIRAEDMINHRIDCALVFAYGRIIPAAIIEAVPQGILNIHPSLLPSFRGPAPTVFPLLLGETQTGVSLMVMDHKMDHGPVLAQEKHLIADKDTQASLTHTLGMNGAILFADYISSLATRTSSLPQPHVQQHEHATFTPLLTRDDGYLDRTFVKRALARDETLLDPDDMPPIIQKYYSKNPHYQPIRVTPQHMMLRMFRALHPWPGLWTTITIVGTTKRLKITDLEVHNDDIVLTRVQLEGKQEVDFTTFEKAYGQYFYAA